MSNWRDKWIRDAERLLKEIEKDCRPRHWVVDYAGPIILMGMFVGGMIGLFLAAAWC